MGLAPEVYRSTYMGVYEWQEEHSGGERPVYKLQDNDDAYNDDAYLYYCDSEGQWWVSDKEHIPWTQGVGIHESNRQSSDAR